MVKAVVAARVGGRIIKQAAAAIATLVVGAIAMVSAMLGVLFGVAVTPSPVPQSTGAGLHNQRPETPIMCVAPRWDRAALSPSTRLRAGLADNPATCVPRHWLLAVLAPAFATGQWPSAVRTVDGRSVNHRPLHTVALSDTLGV